MAEEIDSPHENQLSHEKLLSAFGNRPCTHRARVRCCQLWWLAVGKGDCGRNPRRYPAGDRRRNSAIRWCL